MSGKLLKWFLFSVIVAILPVALDALKLLTRSKGVTLDGIVGKGELLLIVVGLSAAAVGDLVEKNSHYVKLKLLSAFLGVLTIGIASWYFAYVADSYASGASVSSSVVATTSIWLLIFAVATGAGCLIIPESKT